MSSHYYTTSMVDNLNLSGVRLSPYSTMANEDHMTTDTKEGLRWFAREVEEAALPAVLRYVLWISALAALGACHSKASQASASEAAGQTGAAAARVHVDTVPIATAPMPQFITLSGTLAGNEESDVAAGTSGKVLATYVERGSFVKKGAILARLDARVAQAVAHEAGAQLATLKAQRELAKADCERSQRLFDKGAITKVEFDRAQTSCRTADSSLAAAAARAESTGASLRDSTIRAPFSGVVAERSISAGEYVRPETKVATLVAVDPLRLELTIPEAYAARIGKDMKVQFRTAADVSAKPGADAPLHTAVVRYVGPAVRRQSRDLIVEAVVANADRALRPGMFVTARLDLGQAPVPVVPREAVRSDGGLNHVFVVVGGRVEDRLVQLGEEVSGRVAILSGAKTGETAVAKALPDLRDGVLVD